MAETLNGRWQNTVIKLVDPNQGTREAAANALYNMAQSQGIDLRDFELRKKKAAARRPASRSPSDDRQHLELIEENLRLRHQLIDAKIANTKLELKTHDQEEEIKQLQAAHYYELNAVSDTCRSAIADLQQKLAAAERKVADLTADAAHNTYDPPAEDRAETQAEDDDMALAQKLPPDAWLPKIEKFLTRYSIDRISTFELLEECIGLPARDHTTDVGRRISRIMGHIGGWKSSTNINFEGTICRGYIKMEPDELERLKSKHVGPHGQWRPPSAKRK